jgi:hypothetical protein
MARKKQLEEGESSERMKTRAKTLQIKEQRKRKKESYKEERPKG